MPQILNLRAFLDILRKNDQLFFIESEFDPYLAIAKIHRRVIARRGHPCCLPTPKAQVEEKIFPLIPVSYR